MDYSKLRFSSASPVFSNSPPPPTKSFCTRRPLPPPPSISTPQLPCTPLTLRQIKEFAIEAPRKQIGPPPDPLALHCSTPSPHLPPPPPMSAYESLMEANLHRDSQRRAASPFQDDRCPPPLPLQRPAPCDATLATPSPLTPRPLHPTGASAAHAPSCTRNSRTSSSSPQRATLTSSSPSGPPALSSSGSITTSRATRSSTPATC